ncbi:hypothetical protein [Thalassotalea marina]|uniref:Uncharacterized protein n=1 Tax=Thalassotalea marina TaxID=1673741 RepID=A0A919BIP1_9GAMM|nr:hypothetical protein [Thalassotalea marina]GHF91772.1 hypothetical protein GCM10017161_19580 [Thalassotalea marina]
MNKEFSGEERRKEDDVWLKALRVTTILAWLVFAIALIISYYAAPEANYGVLRYKGIEVRQFWLTPMTGYLYVLLWISALFSYVTLLIHKYRSRRKTDDKRFNIWLLFVVSVSWVIYIVIQLMK